jgi:hypothetical protein
LSLSLFINRNKFFSLINKSIDFYLSNVVISIREFKYTNNIYYFLKGLGSYKNFQYIAYLIVHNLKAEVIETVLGFDSLIIIFKKDAYKFRLAQDTYFETHLTLENQNERDNGSLRLLAYELIEIIKAKRRSYLTRNKQKKIEDWFHVIFEKWFRI